MSTVDNEELQELKELSAQIFESLVTTKKLRELEDQNLSWDENLWDELVQASLSSVALPEEFGGLGLGLEAVCAVLEAQGAHVAPVPLWSSLVAHRALARDSANFAEILQRACEGEVRTTLALEESLGESLTNLKTVAGKNAEQWVLNGEKVAVPHAASATHFLVAANTGDEAALFLIEANQPGVSLELSRTSNYDFVGHLVLENAIARPVSGGAAAVNALRDEAYLALASLQLGVAQGSLKLTAEYVSGREQFGRPIGSFQSLQHQLADASIATEAIELTIKKALADIANADENADRSVLVASWWARESGTDVVYKCQHVHGGIGVDREYPLHRFFLLSRQAGLTLSNSEAVLESLGDLITERGAGDGV